MKHDILLGGYTRRISKGLHQASFDDQSGILENSRLIATLENPTYLCTDQAGQYIFSLAQWGEQAGLVVLKRYQGQWTILTDIKAKQVNGCHITYDEGRHTIYISNYHEGAIDVYHFSGDNLTHLQRLSHDQSSILPAQSQSRIHFTALSKDGTFLYACNLGGDLIHQYAIEEDGTLTLVSDNPLPRGMGPRHFVHHPHLDILYCIGEFDNKVAQCQVLEDGSLSYITSYDNIPEEFRDGASGAAIRISQDGRFLYTSTRYSNFLTVYAIDDQGNLERIQTIDTVGQVPRDFIIDPSESFILVPHQDSDYISIFKRDTHKGTLTYLSNDVEIPESVCITALN